MALQFDFECSDQGAVLAVDRAYATEMEVMLGDFIESCAGELLRYRRSIGADRVMVFADIKEKHAAHAITGDVSLADTARAAELFLADGVIVTGAASGQEASPGDVRDAVNAARLPVLVGSGISSRNLARFAEAQGFLVGSSLKQGGLWSNPLDRAAVESLAQAFAKLP